MSSWASFQLPAKMYDSKIETPTEFLGYPIGTWHLRHDQINVYLKQLAQQSDKASLEDTGLSHEQRQQLTLVVTSAANQAKLKQILLARSQVKSGQPQQGPLVIWLAYSIHGDEASGSHAAMALSYYLTASQEPWVKQLLEQAVILITPSQNPDGMDRFANWANNNRNQTLHGDPYHREHKQGWAKGRFNHYLADLNRDWLFLRHPESQGRVALFHKWQPHYVGDFHEMGHHSSYFFQPGVPLRTHPLTPNKNQQITDELANFHRQALDRKGQAYYSKQSFDDFFYGKGSTYPDINGAIGVLFEQASARGQQQNTVNGLLTLTKAIDNQFTTSISTLKGNLALKQTLIDYQTDFFNSNKKQGTSSRGYLIDTNDIGMRQQLESLLSQHQIAFKWLTATQSQQQHDYQQTSSLFIPLNQPQRDLVLALFDRRTEFDDATFYDVSSWDLAAAFDLEIDKSAKLTQNQLSDTAPSLALSQWQQDAVVLMIDWQQHRAAPMLAALLRQQIRVKFATSAFSAATPQGVVDFSEGSLIIPLSDNQQLRQQILDLNQQFKLNIVSTTSFAAITGSDLGSPNFKLIKPVMPLILSDRGTKSTEVGQLWYHLDKTLGQHVSLINTHHFNLLNLHDYSHIILADGNYRTLSNNSATKLKNFMQQGGTIIAQKGALVWLEKHDILSFKMRHKGFYQSLFITDDISFAERKQLQAKEAIGGAIVNLQLDTSHPIAYGYQDNQLKVMKNKVLGFKPIDEPFVVAARYSAAPLSSGYLADEYQHAFANTPAIVVVKQGKGALVAITDNLMFRNFWLGSERLINNALYFMPQGLH
ncbi:M14 family zinc carboxypeptidase [Shewanella marina]|uniref:M14 family zinc carboxypeptidase n=1 Tax=Shewanella marina TaxID=487319 RepID=UPI000AC0DFD8|nr:M14 family zinc carboxypeptidase [Shewanella marina]